MEFTHKIATFLTPKLCQLKMIDDNERQAVINAVKVPVDELRGLIRKTQRKTYDCCQQKRLCGIEDADDTMDSDVPFTSELARYLKGKLDGSVAHRPKDVLQWWKKLC